MNERITELKNQCIVREQRGTTASDSYMVDRFDTEQFAKLIVQECASVAGKYVYDNKHNKNGISEFLLKASVKEHFGVEE